MQYGKVIRSGKFVK